SRAGPPRRRAGGPGPGGRDAGVRGPRVHGVLGRPVLLAGPPRRRSPGDGRLAAGGNGDGMDALTDAVARAVAEIRAEVGDAVTLVAVTKGFGPEAAQAAVDAGV